MNPFGSYRALLSNSISAGLGAIEIYNKPQFEYRSECFVILLLNAWELLFKAILSKHRIRIFAPKERNRPYMTLKLWEAIEAAQQYLPASIPHRAVAANIGRLVDYRNNAVHFYNEKGFEVVIYGLSQTSIVNFRDVVQTVFGVDIASRVNLNLLPLSFSSPPDPIAFIGGKTSNHKPAVAEFLRIISDTTKELETAGIDTGRFLTVFKVNLQSTKKIQSADIVAGVQADNPGGVLLVSKKVNPNDSHPHTRKAVVVAIGSLLRGMPFTTYTFDAIVWRTKAKEQDLLCWHNIIANTYQYSPQLISKIKAMTKHDVEESLNEYKRYRHDTRKKG